MASASSILDLAFAMDCTGSMGSYIESAKNNIRSIIDEINSKEHATIRLALVEYRDHPPQDTTFVTRTHGFTNTVTEMKSWLDQSSAQGGGDGPEAVADALNDALNLAWRSDATKVCILISDAPPHGLNRTGDSFPDGCPAGHDPMAIARKMAEKSVTLYVVGVEPPIVPYREFFMALAHITGGQYVPMVDAARLAQMIIAGVREEISLNGVMHSSRRDIVRVMRQATKDGIDDLETATRLQRTLDDKKVRVNRMNNTAGIPSRQAEECYSKCVDMADMQRQYKLASTSSTTKTTPLDYQLEEGTSITLDQSKRIVQKAKSWNYPLDEPSQSRRSIPCRYGEKCTDSSSNHRSKYEHPSNMPPSSSLRTPCKYGSECYDHSRSHQEKFSHLRTSNNRRDQSDENRDMGFQGRSSARSIPCRYGDNCTNYNDDHRGKFSHTNNKSNLSRQPANNHRDQSDEDGDTSYHGRSTTRSIPCRYGDNCTNYNDDHRGKFSHASNKSNISRRSVNNRRDESDEDQKTSFHGRSSTRVVSCRYGDNCTNYNDEHRGKFSHASNKSNISRRSGDSGRDHRHEQKSKYSDSDD